MDTENISWKSDANHIHKNYKEAKQQADIIQMLYE